MIAGKDPQGGGRGDGKVKPRGEISNRTKDCFAAGVKKGCFSRWNALVDDVTSNV
ncbi:MAG: hypothetical protein J0H74_14750 [Chitinophagaceae bacterium]|nr:hypothetical protein [Chitinophagaceae bacterium]